MAGFGRIRIGSVGVLESLLGEISSAEELAALQAQDLVVSALRFGCCMSDTVMRCRLIHGRPTAVLLV